MKPLLFYRIIGIITNVGNRWDILAPNEEDAITYSYEHFNPEPPVMLDANHYSDEYVLAHYGSMINDRYREGREDDDDKHIAQMVAAYVTRVPHVLYRGVGKDVFRIMRENAKKSSRYRFVRKIFFANLSC